MQVLRLRFSAVLIVVGLLIAGLGGIYLDGFLKFMAILAGCGIAAWPLISVVIALRAHESAQRAQHDEIRRQVNDLQAQSVEIEKRYPMLSAIGPEEMLRKLHEFKALSQKRTTREEALRQHPNRDDIASQCDSLANELFIADKRIKELTGAHPSLIDVEREGTIGSAIEKARSDAVRAEKSINDLTAERDELKLKLARDEAKETVPQETLEEEIADAESELDRLKLRREACMLAVKTLDEAISEFRSSHLARIEQRGSALLEQITSMPYRVRLDDQLEPLGVEQAGSFFRPEQLSRGLRDQLYFALRLASAEEVFGAAHLPLLLDDPFVNFDGDRLSATLQMLDKLSESHQVVLFTHDRTYGDWKRPTRILER